MLKKKFVYLLLAGFLGLMLFSCSRGSGCPSETAAGNTNKKGQLTTKPGKSNLFDKKTQKAMKRN